VNALKVFEECVIVSGDGYSSRGRRNGGMMNECSILAGIYNTLMGGWLVAGLIKRQRGESECVESFRVCNRLSIFQKQVGSAPFGSQVYLC
jgi:hypothetical protein